MFSVWSPWGSLLYIALGHLPFTDVGPLLQLYLRLICTFTLVTSVGVVPGFVLLGAVCRTVHPAFRATARNNRKRARWGDSGRKIRAARRNGSNHDYMVLRSRTPST